MKLCDITKLRLQNQQIFNSKFDTAKEAVSFMGAIQAQDYPMSKWAVGIRLPEARVRHIEDAVDKGEIIRTHVLRPTWHLVSADDIHWMLDLTAPRIKSVLKLRQEKLELSTSLINKCCKMMEAAIKLAERYFRSHAPATLNDFVWWSGLTIKDARCGLEGINSKLVSETIESQTYHWFPETISDSGEDCAYLLPAFDVFIISYSNIDAIFSSENHKKAVSSNGIFKPVIVINGEVTGLWKRTLKKDTVETGFFRSHNKMEKELVKEAAHKFSNFLGMKINMRSI